VRTAAARPRRASAQSKKPTQPKPSETKSRAEIEKEEGNEHYKQGDYVAAIKSYTRCLGYGAQNAVVLSNRAMAFLKNREFAKAEDDCTLALKVDPAHVKSFLRRGTARNALGKHRLALLDFEKSAELDPKNRQIQSQLASTRDLMRAAIKRVPKRTNFQMEVVGTPVSKDKSVKLEIIEEDENENKENTLTQRNKVNAKNSKIEASTHAEDGAKTDEAPSMSQVASSNAGHRPTRTIQLPSLPKKAPTTAYEFTRVWKTFSPKGDADRKIQLLELRARYLRLVQPASLRTIFKNSIESDLLCEIFSAFRQATLAADSLSRADAEFVLLFAQELAQVPRFSMTIMFLSEKEKQDMQWVIGKLLSVLGNADGDAQAIGAIAQLKQAYELS
jgi:tetratricopeptide (TPR) repeat protein